MKKKEKKFLSNFALSLVVLLGLFVIFTFGAFVGQSITLQEYDCRNPIAFQYHEYELRQCEYDLQNMTIQYEIAKAKSSENYKDNMFFYEFYNQYLDLLTNISDSYFQEKESRLMREYEYALCYEGIYPHRKEFYQ